jgi:Ca2+-dependent lipid-binding protein
MPSVKVVIVEASNVPRMDATKGEARKADPYVVLTVGNQTRKTSVIGNSEAPVWKEAFTWDRLRPNDVLRLTLWDKDYSKPDDKISTSSIALGQLEANQMYDIWIKLDAVPGVKRGGRLHLQILKAA